MITHIEFVFREMPPEHLIEKEYERLDELKAEGVFVSLQLKADQSGGVLQMHGRSMKEIEEAVSSLPLYPFAEWKIKAME